MLPILAPAGDACLILVRSGVAFLILLPGGVAFLILVRVKDVRLVPGGDVFPILVPRRPVTRNPLRAGGVLLSLGRAQGRRLFLGLARFLGPGLALGPARERQPSEDGCRRSGPPGGGGPPNRGLKLDRGWPPSGVGCLSGPRGVGVLPNLSRERVLDRGMDLVHRPRLASGRRLVPKRGLALRRSPGLGLGSRRSAGGCRSGPPSGRGFLNRRLDAGGCPNPCLGGGDWLKTTLFPGGGGCPGRSRSGAAPGRERPSPASVFSPRSVDRSLIQNRPATRSLLPGRGGAVPDRVAGGPASPAGAGPGGSAGWPPPVASSWPWRPGWWR
jgi:hypothetical protein